MSSYVSPTHCPKCKKLLPGQPIWMVIRPGEEWRYICQCASFLPPRYFEVPRPDRSRWSQEADTNPTVW